MNESFDLMRILGDLWQSAGGINLLFIPLTGFFFWGSVKRFLPVKGRARNAGLFVTCLLFAHMNVHIGLGGKSIFIMLPLYIGLMCLLCGGRMLARISIGLILFPIVVSSSALFNLVVPSSFEGLRNGTTMLLWLAVYLFVGRAMPHATSEPIRSTRLWLLVDALTLMPFGSTLIIMVYTERVSTALDPRDRLRNYIIHNETVLAGVLFFVVVSALAILVAVVILARHETLEQEQVLWQMNRQYYENMEQTQQQVRRLRHDMENHLDAMAGLGDGAMREYLEQLRASAAATTAKSYCENRVVNAVLASKMPLIDENGIGAKIELVLPNDLPLTDIELCAIYANCLDNAIEASVQLPQGQRALSLRSYADKGLFTLELTNKMNGKLNMRDGVIVTSKADAKNHGFGLVGIKEIVQKYNGLMEATQTEDVFSMVVSIPLVA